MKKLKFFKRKIVKNFGFGRGSILILFISLDIYEGKFLKCLPAKIEKS